MNIMSLLPMIIIAILVVFAIVIILTSYIKAPPDKAFIISGLKKTPKVLIGRAGIKLPILERKDELLIKQISIDIKTGDYVPTLDFIGVNIDAVAKVKIRTDAEGIQLAMKNFLNMKEPQIMEALVDSLQGNMREIIGTITLKELCNDRKSFGDQVQEKAQVDMNRLGIEIISCNIQHVEDQNDLIIALGQDNMASIQKNASIAKANADRDVAIAQAQARKEANDAKVASDTEIAVKQNELAIKQAELKTIEDTKKAQADAAYKIQEEEQRKSIEVNATNANIARQEREVELKKAEAEKFAKQQAADAALYERQRKAEAEKFEIEKQQEVKKTQAEADLFKKQKEADAKKAEAAAELFAKQQEAEGIRAVGEAEAKAIEAKGIAEAEALEKKAEAMKKYGQAAMMEMIVKALPDMAKAIAEPMTAIDKVTIIGGSEGNGMDTMPNAVVNTMVKTFEAVKESTGFDMLDVMKANTYDAKVNKNINIEGLPSEVPAEAIKEEISNTVHNELVTKSAKQTKANKKID